MALLASTKPTRLPESASTSTTTTTTTTAAATTTTSCLGKSSLMIRNFATSPLVTNQRSRAGNSDTSESSAGRHHLNHDSSCSNRLCCRLGTTSSSLSSSAYTTTTTTTTTTAAAQQRLHESQNELGNNDNNLHKKNFPVGSGQRVANGNNLRRERKPPLIGASCCTGSSKYSACCCSSSSSSSTSKNLSLSKKALHHLNPHDGTTLANNNNGYISSSACCCCWRRLGSRVTTAAKDNNNRAALCYQCQPSCSKSLATCLAHEVKQKRLTTKRETSLEGQEDTNCSASPSCLHNNVKSSSSSSLGQQMKEKSKLRLLSEQQNCNIMNNKMKSRRRENATSFNETKQQTTFLPPSKSNSECCMAANFNLTKKKNKTKQQTFIGPQHQPLECSIDDNEGCIKCQLIAKWTSAQANETQQLSMQQEQAEQEEGPEPEEGKRGSSSCFDKNKSLKKDNEESSRNLNRKSLDGEGKLFRILDSDKLNNHDDEEDDDDDDEISSLTSDGSSSFERITEEANFANKYIIDKENDNPNDDHHDQDKWSLSSCYAAARSRRRSMDFNALHSDNNSSQNSLLENTRLSQKETTIIIDKNENLIRNNNNKRLAPKPPGESRSISNNTNTCCVDSGNTSATEMTSNSSQSSSTTTSRLGNSNHNNDRNGAQQQEMMNKAEQQKMNLLSESEVYSIEHFLKSHKSSIYVCGCMANLYLTNTQLVDNGRCSKPTNEGWQLSKTGVPVLTFDSGLAKNRSRRKLTINLTERGSGFVLWSDIIDHLSNYRAFNAKIHSSSSNNNNNDNICETFHVMYLSSNHRIMVGLSFDDQTCARLFLKQVELVTSDPANISLTGPKLAHSLAKVGRLSKLLLKKDNENSKKKKKKKISTATMWPAIDYVGPEGKEFPEEQLHKSRRAKSIGSISEQPFRSSLVAGGDISSKASSRCSNNNNSLSSLSIAGKQTKISRVVPGGNNYATGTTINTWSTLKRAIRLKYQQQEQANNLKTSNRLKSNHNKDEADEDEESKVLFATFQPKPLASLASIGKIYRTNKKLPRKCDISAPCLFQHVTKVDIPSLNHLYSKSLVSTSGHNESPMKTTNNIVGVEARAQSDNNNQRPQEMQEVIVSSIKKQSAELESRGKQMVDNNSERMISPAQDNNNNNNKRRPEMASSVSTSSCYSSASISPTNSEYGCAANEQQQQQQKLAHESTAINSAADRKQQLLTKVITKSSINNKLNANDNSFCLVKRPLPPKVPQRTSSNNNCYNYPADPTTTTAKNNPSSTIMNMENNQSNQVVPSVNKPGGANVSSNNNKIQAIIRDLQLQTSLEMVDAKRKLMADIADQVVARRVGNKTKASQFCTTKGSPSSSSSTSSISSFNSKVLSRL